MHGCVEGDRHRRNQILANNLGVGAVVKLHIHCAVVLLAVRKFLRIKINVSGSLAASMVPF